MHLIKCEIKTGFEDIKRIFWRLIFFKNSLFKPVLLKKYICVCVSVSELHTYFSFEELYSFAYKISIHAEREASRKERLLFLECHP